MCNPSKINNEQKKTQILFAVIFSVIKITHQIYQKTNKTNEYYYNEQ